MRFQKAPAPARTKALLLLGVLVVLAWSGPLRFSAFSHDDREAIVGNPLVQAQLPAHQAFFRDYWQHLQAAGHWRPMATLSLRLDWWLWGEDARGYHLTNLVLHLIVVGLAYSVLQRLQPPCQNSCLAGLACFALHPALADSVAWISGRTSLLSAAGGLLGLRLLQTILARQSPDTKAGLSWTALATASSVLGALAAKEDGLIFAWIALLMAWRISIKAALAALGGASLALTGWLAVRWIALGTALPNAPDAPLADASLLERAQVGALALLQALRLVVLPVSPCPSMCTASLLPELTLVRGGVASLIWFAFALLLVFVFARGLRARRFSLVQASCLTSLLACLPWTQWIPAGEIFAPRFLYLPLLCAVPLLSQLWRALTPWPQYGGQKLVALALAIILAHANSAIYASRQQYWQVVLAHDARNASAWNALGTAYREQGQNEEARLAWIQAVKLKRRYSRPWTNLAALALAEGELLRAEELFLIAVRAGPRNPVPRVMFGQLLHSQGRWPEALEHFSAATKLAPGMLAAWVGLAQAASANAQATLAKEAWQEVLRLSPGHPAAARALDP